MMNYVNDLTYDNYGEIRIMRLIFWKAHVFGTTSYRYGTVTVRNSVNGTEWIRQTVRNSVNSTEKDKDGTRKVEISLPTAGGGMFANFSVLNYIYQLCQRMAKYAVPIDRLYQK